MNVGANWDYRKNCISSLRLIAAVQVMLGHVGSHLEVSVPLLEWTSWGLYFFNGVPLFFFFSGFLIWLSIENYNNYKSYYINRFLRIYPELWGGVFLEIILIVFFVNPISLPDLLLFAGTQATFLQFWTPDSLRSFGCGTPNGSLWTICVMIQFYIFVWPIRSYIHMKRLSFWIILELIFIAIGAATQIIKQLLPLIFYKLYCQTIVQYFWIFFFGIIIAQYREKIIPFLVKYWYIVAIGAVLMRFSPFDLRARNFLIFYTICCCLFSLAIAYRFYNLAIGLDISYPLFIYHMLFVNVFIELGYTNNVTVFIVCIAISVIAAYLSTVTIGRISLKKKYIE